MLPVLVTAPIDAWGDAAGLNGVHGGRSRMLAMRDAVQRKLLAATDSVAVAPIAVAASRPAILDAPSPVPQKVVSVPIMPAPAPRKVEVLPPVRRPQFEGPPKPPPMRQAKRVEEPFPSSSPEFEARLERVRRGEAGLVEKVDFPRRGIVDVPGGGSSLA